MGWGVPVTDLEQDLLQNTGTRATCREMNPTCTDALSQTEFIHLL